MFGKIAICCGRASQLLGERICEILGIEPEPVDFTRFSNGNLMVNFIGETVREKDVFVIQSGERSILRDRDQAFGLVSGDIIELLQMIYALKDSAGRITAVTPYFPYARSDKKDKPRIAIAAKMIFDMLEAVRADRVLTMTLHCPQSQGFSNIPVDQLHADEVFLDKITSFGQERLAFVAPDSGSILNNEFLAMHVSRSLKKLGMTPDIETGYVKKVRIDDSETPHVKTVEGIEDLSGRTVIMNDDETLSGGSLIMCAEIAKERGAKDIYAFVTHGVLSGEAVKRIEQSPLTKLYVTDTVEFNEEAAEEVVGGPLTRIETLSVARIFAEAIKRTHEGKSLSSLFLGK
ncbi:MAG: ribose-phosphate diphosphokinase [Candidatus Aegiribacteria sp.]|nr:ribose-phosphate diphosphokinase [Candidatus Aegiribacteria sp.]MBD3294660.1 ribose-phosphate diphosphokinase [Candidatus Fermentibacteria bacterium]